MPDPQSGTKCTLVSPTAPKAAQDADEADPGQVETLKQTQRETKSGKYGSQPVKAHKKDSEENKDKKGWIEVVLIDDSDAAVAGAPVEVELPDGSVSSGTTDEKGLFRVDGIDPGSQCKIKFPELDKDAWEPA